MEELKAKIKEYGRLAATLSRQAGEIPSYPKESRKQKQELLRQSVEASRECRELIQELKRLEAA